MLAASVASLHADESSAVAKIGTAYYDTMTEAITAANETVGGGAVIEILKDFSESFSETYSTGVPITNSCAIVGADGVNPVMTVSNKTGYGLWIDGARDSGRGAITVALSNFVITASSRTTTSRYDHFIRLRHAEVVFGDGFSVSNVAQSTHGVIAVDASARLYMEDGCELVQLTSNHGAVRVHLADAANVSGSRECRLVINGGTIRDCIANQDEGVAVDVVGENVAFEMNGGLITNCTLAATATAEYTNASAAVWVQMDATKTNKWGVSLNGGTIAGNLVGVATTANDASAFVLLSGDATVEGNDLADIWLKNSDSQSLYVDGVYTGSAVLRRSGENSVGVEAAKVKDTSGTCCGYSRVKAYGDGKEDLALVRTSSGSLVWAESPVKMGSTSYRSFSEAMAAIGSDGVGTVTLCADGPDFYEAVTLTNSTVEIVGDVASRVLVWSREISAMNFRSCDVSFSNVIVTATQGITKTVTGETNMRTIGFVNFCKGDLKFKGGSGVSNVTCNAHGVVCVGTDGVDSSNPADTVICTLRLEPGSIMYGLKGNYGVLRCIAASGSIYAEGARIESCQSVKGEGVAFFFLKGGKLTLTDTVLTNCTCTKDNSAIIWNNAGSASLKCRIYGGSIAGNTAGAIVNALQSSSAFAHAVVDLDGDAVLSGCTRGICVTNGSVCVNAASTWTGSAEVHLRGGSIADGLCILGTGSSAAVSRLDWMNASSFSGCSLQSIDGVLVFAPDGSTSESVFGESVAYGGSAGLCSSLADAISGAASSETVLLLKDTVLDAPIKITKTLSVDGCGHVIDANGTNFVSITDNIDVYLCDMVVTNNAWKNEIGWNDSSKSQAKLTLGSGFVLTGFTNSTSKTYSSFCVYGASTIYMEDGAVVENGATQVGVFRVQGANAKFVMNGGTIRNITFDSTSAHSGEGAAVNVQAGSFDMNGGAISNCVWDSTAASPDFSCVVHINKPSYSSSIKLNGGTITDNTAGIYMFPDYPSRLEVSGSAYVYGNSAGDYIISTPTNLVQTGTFTGKLGVSTASCAGDGVQFGLWEFGSGTENFVRRTYYGVVSGDALVWAHDLDGTLIFFR